MQWLKVGVNAPKLVSPVDVEVGGLCRTFAVVRLPQRAAAGPMASTFWRDQLNMTVAASAGDQAANNESASQNAGVSFMILSPLSSAAVGTDVAPHGKVMLWKTDRLGHERKLIFS